MWRNITKNKEDVMRLVKPGASFVVFDTETTGVDPSKDKIIQFAAQHYVVTDNGSFGLVESYNQYINPGEMLPDKIVAITGITDYVLSFFDGEEEYIDKIFLFLQRGDFLLAYNSPFDLRMLAGMQARLGTNYYVPKCLDALPMARDCVKKEEVENFKLATILKHFYPDKHFQFHSALEDVSATAYVFKKLVEFYVSISGADEPGKKQVHLCWACPFINERKQSQQRIKVCLDPRNKNVGDVFFDYMTRSWDHKKTKTAKELFESIDLENLERQVMSRYAWKFNASTMDELAGLWLKDYRRRKKEAAKAKEAGTA